MTWSRSYDLVITVLIVTQATVSVQYKPASEAQLIKAFQTLDTEAQGFLTQERLSKLMMEEGNHILMKLIVS